MPVRFKDKNRQIARKYTDITPSNNLRLHYGAVATPACHLALITDPLIVWAYPERGIPTHFWIAPPDQS